MSLTDPTMFSAAPLPPRARNLPRQGGKRRNRDSTPSATETSIASIPPPDDVLGPPVRLTVWRTQACSGLCRLVQACAGLCRLVQACAGLCRLVQACAGGWDADEVECDVVE